MLTAVDSRSARGHMLFSRSVTYLNAGSFGPLPRSVFQATTHLRRQLAEDPADFLTRKAPALLWRAREHLAGFVGCPPPRIFFTASVSAAVSLIASSLPLTGPGEILLSDQEYPTMCWCLERMAERCGLSIRVFPIPVMPADSQEIARAAIAAMRPQTKLIFFSHIVSATGLILPAATICEEARQRGIISVVDGAHSVASISLTLTDIPCDFYVGSCHKWLLAPSGSSFVFLGREREERLQPLTVSWGHHSAQPSLQPDERDQFGSTPRLRRLECEGTRDICPWLAIPAAIEFQRLFGADGAMRHMRSLAHHARERLASIGILTPTVPPDRAMSGPMTSFNLPPQTRAAQLQRALWEQFGIEVSCIDRPNHPILRLSPHIYNSASDIDYLAESLATLIR